MSSRIVSFDTVSDMETLAGKARGLAGLIETLAVACRKEGGMLSVNVDALEGLHGLSLDVCYDAKSIHKKVWETPTI
jgi:hypothetical protein